MKARRTASLFITFFLFLALQLPAQADVFSGIAGKYGVTVKYEIDAEFFPKSWMAPPIAATAQRIDESELPRFPDLLDEALAQYPPELIKKYLKGIYLAGSLFFYGQEYGATNSDNVVYLNDKGQADGYSDTFLTGSFHHEFAHILYRKYSPEKMKWHTAVYPDFKYGKGGIEALKQGKISLTGSDYYYKMGLLSEYSMSSAEEDFCVYSDKILTSYPKFKTIADQYPPVKNKFDLWLSIYRALDPGFSVEPIEAPKTAAEKDPM